MQNFTRLLSLFFICFLALGAFNIQAQSLSISIPNGATLETCLGTLFNDLSDPNAAFDPLNPVPDSLIIWSVNDSILATQPPIGQDPSRRLNPTWGDLGLAGVQNTPGDIIIGVEIEGVANSRVILTYIVLEAPAVTIDAGGPFTTCQGEPFTNANDRINLACNNSSELCDCDDLMEWFSLDGSNNETPINVPIENSLSPTIENLGLDGTPAAGVYRFRTRLDGGAPMDFTYTVNEFTCALLLLKTLQLKLALVKLFRLLLALQLISQVVVQMHLELGGQEEVLVILNL